METPTWKTRTEAAKHLRCSPATLDRLANKGTIRRYKLAGGNKVLFKVTELDAAVQGADNTSD